MLAGGDSLAAEYELAEAQVEYLFDFGREVLEHSEAAIHLLIHCH